MSWDSAQEVMEDCGKWCQERFFDLPSPQTYCCWYGIGKAQGQGFEICSLSNANYSEPMNQQALTD